MEHLILWIVYGILFLLFMILGVIFLCGKGDYLIAGYNTASPAERAKFNKKALCRSMAVMMFAIAFSFIVSALGIFIDIIPPWIGHVLLLAIVLVGLIYINTSKRVKCK